MFFGTCYHAGWLKHCEMGYIKASKKRLHAAVQLGWSKYSLNQLVSIPSPYLGAIFFVSGRCMRARPVLQPCALPHQVVGTASEYSFGGSLALDFGQPSRLPIPRSSTRCLQIILQQTLQKSRYMGTYVYISHITHTHNYIYIHNYIYNIIIYIHNYIYNIII